MPKVPEISKPKPPKRDTVIVCTRGGKPLTESDQKALDDFIAYVKSKKTRKTLT
jgi:hypothetical protein